MRSWRQGTGVAGLVSISVLAAGPAIANDLPPLRCGLARAPAATCQWTNGGACAWEEGGTPTICEPVAGPAIRLRPAGSYRGGYFNASASAGVAYDFRTRRMLVADVAQQTIDVVDLGGPAVNADRPARLPRQYAIDVAPWLPALPPGQSDVAAPRGAGVPRGLALRWDGLMAVVVQSVQQPILRGRVAFVRTDAVPGAPPSALLDVGYMPARATFTPDGRRLLVANEGEPSDDYLTDPLGTVSIVDLRRGLPAATVRDVDFRAFDPLKAELSRRGVRLVGPRPGTPDPTDTAPVSADLEPSDIAVDPASRLAWVTLPESNAVGLLDIHGARFLDILSHGSKDHNLVGDGLDPTDNDDLMIGDWGLAGVNIQPWPIHGMYMSRRVALAPWPPVLVYPSEGVRRNFTAFMDEIRLDDPALQLDPVAFPPDLQARLRGLRLKISRVDGDRDHDGDLDRIFSLGGRSFSLRTPDNRLLYDSGDDFEQLTAQAMHDTLGALVPGQPYFLFNAPDDENSLDETSDLRGPEPISVAVGRIGRRTYAFIGLERVGGIMTYDISNPTRPGFVYYINNRNFGLNPKDPASGCVKRAAETGQCPNVGDLSPEDLVFVPQRLSPAGKPLLLVSNATSGSATIFQIDAYGPP